ncbi:unnamed protein product [Orchesella dallaii]|uniref:Protein kinase domain-containing protein n=1 Tax=Orchesella dallaii TaxID=48710 RepID=A0ABP1Q845_9HEXA
MRTWKNLSYHPNVVSYIGGVTSDIPNDSAHLFVEYCNGGDMETYLFKFKSNSDSSFYFHDEKNEPKLDLKGRKVVLRIAHLMVWAEQCANGLEFLRSQRVVHRDIAARNILLYSSQSCEDEGENLSVDPRNYIAKITDFDLSRVLKDIDNCYQSTPGPDKPELPIAWMALEALKDSKYTTESDVWSLGVLFWEMFTLAKEDPYYSFGIQKQMELIRFLESGRRLDEPECAPQEMKDIMQKCWQKDPKMRPKVSEIHSKLRQFNETNRNNSLGDNADAIEKINDDTKNQRPFYYVKVSNAPNPKSQEGLSDHCEGTLDEDRDAEFEQVTPENVSNHPSNSAGPSNSIIKKKYMLPSDLKDL